jgi:integrase
VTALHTGLRWGELVALRWSDVDLKAGRIVVRQSAWRGHVGTPKGHKAREIPLNEVVLAELKAWRHLRGEWVFCTERGARLGEQAETSRLEAACKLAGLRNVTWHVMRHSFASHLVMRGVPLKTVQELLGHKDIATTMRYAHLSPSVKTDAVSTLTLSSQRRDGNQVSGNC